MIIVRIERWPDDTNPNDEAQRHRRTDIAQAVIRNDHSGSRETGSYEISLYDPPPYNPWGGTHRSGTVEDFPRRDLGVWDLLYRGLGSVIGRRESRDW
jgi:hypothetical protein